MPNYYCQSNGFESYFLIILHSYFIFGQLQDHLLKPVYLKHNLSGLKNYLLKRRVSKLFQRFSVDFLNEISTIWRQKLALMVVVYLNVVKTGHFICITKDVSLNIKWQLKKTLS